VIEPKFYAMPTSVCHPLRALTWFFLGLVLVALVWMLWGADFLMAAGPLPSRVDAAVVLQGSIVAEKTRIAGAMALLKQGIAERVLLSVPKESYWGESIPPVARVYLERMYGAEYAARVDFCETSAAVKSTEEEADAALGCIREHHWHAIAIVTSEYHTRRAGILWRRKVQRQDPAIRISVESVADPEFQLPWWRHRQSAKMCLGESLKLIWTMLER
jgi:uncharacterized SAM-binding protein YcdF (DUF218 family)